MLTIGMTAFDLQCIDMDAINRRIHSNSVRREVFTGVGVRGGVSAPGLCLEYGWGSQRTARNTTIFAEKKHTHISGVSTQRE